MYVLFLNNVLAVYEYLSDTMGPWNCCVVGTLTKIHTLCKFGNRQTVYSDGTRCDAANQKAMEKNGNENKRKMAYCRTENF